jgi:excisionase family DNA binding protein
MTTNQAINQSNEYQTIKRQDAAKMLCVSPETIDELIKTRRIKSFKVTGKRAVRILKSSLDNYIASMTRY